MTKSEYLIFATVVLTIAISLLSLKISIDTNNQFYILSKQINEDITNTKTDIKLLTSKYNGLNYKVNYISNQTKLINQRYWDLRKDKNLLNTSLRKLENRYDILKKEIYTLSAINLKLKDEATRIYHIQGFKTPTVQELIEFIHEDKTDELEYSDEFDCTEFANTFIRNFRKAGYFSCLTEITLVNITSKKLSAHSIVAVMIDNGTVLYVEPQTDDLKTQKELELGKEYCFKEDDKYTCYEDLKIIKISSCFGLEGSNDPCKAINLCS